MTMNLTQPRLTIVGAGPGDPELISVKGHRAISSARVILYDALVSTELLDLAPNDAELIYVGKRGGQKKTDQNYINELIVSKALERGSVLRLKGGDPFVFGRGSEEKDIAEKAGIQVEIIPGISSATGLATLQGVPLTCRGINESFWVLTGTTRKGKLSEDIRLAAQSTATAIILMGVKKLSEIVDSYYDAGKSDLPIMIIQNGSLPNQKVVIGLIQNIERIAQENSISSPAIMVIGHTVAQNKSQNDIHRLIEIANRA